MAWLRTPSILPSFPPKLIIWLGDGWHGEKQNTEFAGSSYQRRSGKFQSWSSQEGMAQAGYPDGSIHIWSEVVSGLEECPGDPQVRISRTWSHVAVWWCSGRANYADRCLGRQLLNTWPGFPEWETIMHWSPEATTSESGKDLIRNGNGPRKHLSPASPFALIRDRMTDFAMEIEERGDWRSRLGQTS